MYDPYKEEWEGPYDGKWKDLYDKEWGLYEKA